MNKLMEGLVLGGFSYEVAFPFSGVAERQRQKIFGKLAKILNKETLGVATKILDDKRYIHYLRAIEVVEKRFLFYKNLLESEELKSKYLAELGIEDLTLRVVFAMYGCITHTNKILHHMDNNLVGDLVNDSILAMEMGYNRWVVFYLKLKEPITICRMTGVCICEEGDKEPYTNSCVLSDPTRIIISNQDQKKRIVSKHSCGNE